MKRLITLILVACFGMAGTANAHMVAFGWNDNGNGTITMYGQHWHGAQSSPFSDNGGVSIGIFGTDPSTWQLFQWTGVLNDIGGDIAGMDAMVASGILDGYAIDPAFFTDSADENDWFFTNPLVLGNGTWGLFTGTDCCVDTMSAPGQFVITGISSVPDGTGPGNPGAVPIPAAAWLFGSALLGLTGISRRKRASLAA